MNYWKINKEDVCNGEGLRVVLWLSGCSHKCKGCQNPQTWDANSGIPFDEQAKEELFRELNKDYISGLTLTGGDPLFESNLDNVLDLVNEIRLSFPQRSIWLYTGYGWNDIWCNENALIDDYASDYNEQVLVNHSKRQKIVSQCDVLIDGRYIDSQRDITLPYCGSRNQHVIDIQKSLQEGELIPWII